MSKFAEIKLRSVSATSATRSARRERRPIDRGRTPLAKAVAEGKQQRRLEWLEPTERTNKEARKS